MRFPSLILLVAAQAPNSAVIAARNLNGAKIKGRK